MNQGLSVLFGGSGVIGILPPQHKVALASRDLAPNEASACCIASVNFGGQLPTFLG